MKICEAKINDKWIEVPFHGIFQYSTVIAPSAMLGGHNGGVVAYPVAIVDIEGYLVNKELNSIRNIKEVK